MQHHWLLVHTNHRFPLTQRLFVDRQDVLHAPDVLLIQFRHAPHFFPATASARGFRAGRGSSLGPPGAPVCASPLLRSAGAPSNVRGLRAADHRPGRRCVAGVAHPARSFSPVAAARTRPAPARLADSVGWSARRSSASGPRSWRPDGRFAPRLVAAGPRLVAPFAPAADRSVTGGVVPAVPAWTIESAVASSCPSYRLGHSVKTSIKLYYYSCGHGTSGNFRKQVLTDVMVEVGADRSCTPSTT